MNFKKLVSTENYIVCEIKKVEDIPELCEEMDREGFQLISSLSIPVWDLESPDKMTSLGVTIQLIFKKMELNFTANNLEQALPMIYCPFEFKSKECGYVGWDIYCDKTYADCNSKNNIKNFGGVEVK